MRSCILLLLATALLTGTGVAENAPPSLDAEIQRFEAVAHALAFYREQLDDVLAAGPPSLGDNAAIGRAVRDLASIGEDLALVEQELARVMDDAVVAHLRGEQNAITDVLTGYRQVQRDGDRFQESVDEFLAYKPGRVIPQEMSNALEGLRSRVKDSPITLGFEYYRAYVPVRFVQFIEEQSQTLGEDRLQYNLDLTNQIFRPARLRFMLFANIIVPGTEMPYLHRRDAGGNYIKDDEGHLQDGIYAWPQEVWKSPLVWPLHWPQIADCEGLVLPPNRIESRYWAQMRAGTYCCREGEMLVYINQGRSNGGQYPWYSRIIGMSAYHMAEPGSVANRFVFPHEVGHYLGLPHTFPSHNEYSIDYDLARMMHCPSTGSPKPGQQRFYEPHANLVNPETGQMAKLSLFWDLVFKPICGPAILDPGVYCLFFNSREEAAMWEDDLQPIEQWSNGHLCQSSHACCGHYWPSLRLRLTVGAGCRGVEDDFSDCLCPAQEYCTGDPAVAAFSRFGSAPETIQLNVMSYGYPIMHTSGYPEEMVEMTFLCASQLEQIDRVLTHDVDTFFFPGASGRRPALGGCSSCHAQ